MPPTIAIISSLLVGSIIKYLFEFVNYPTQDVNRLYVLGNILLRSTLFFVLFSLILLLTGFIRFHHFQMVLNFFRNSTFYKNLSNAGIKARIKTTARRYHGN